jgi:hypothetical protein
MDPPQEHLQWGANVKDELKQKILIYQQDPSAPKSYLYRE